MTAIEQNKCIFLFTHPRTASNLLMQMLRNHPGIEAIEYPFIDTYYFGRESLTRRHNARMEAVKQRMQTDPALHQTYQVAFDQLQQSIQNAQKTGKTGFIKEHAFTVMKPQVQLPNTLDPHSHMAIPTITTGNDDSDNDNPTLLPTRFLRGLTPVLLIRHPALVFESILRVSGPTMGANVSDAEFPIEASFRWLRVLYDWFVAHSIRPIVINADEIIAHPTIVQQLCKQLQLDPSGVRLSWDPMPQSTLEGQSSYQQHFFSTIHSSSGVRADKHSAAQGETIDRDVMIRKWQDVYGLEAATALWSFVDAAMPDYEYLTHCEMRLEEKVDMVGKM